MNDWKNQFPKSNICFETNNGILYNADCLELMRSFPKNIFDAIITDVPFQMTSCRWDKIIPFELMWSSLKQIRKDDTPIVLFGDEPFSSQLRMSNVKEYKYDWIWRKERPTNPLLVKKQPPKYTNNIIVFYKKQCKFNPQMIRRKKENKRKNKPRSYADNTKIKTDKYSERVLSGANDYIYQPNILEFYMERGLHPTQKPVKLMEFLVKVYSDKNDLILDFTFGSGSTLIACERLNRRYIGIELEKSCCEVAVERLMKENCLRLF